MIMINDDDDEVNNDDHIDDNEDGDDDEDLSRLAKAVITVSGSQIPPRVSAVKCQRNSISEF